MADVLEEFFSDAHLDDSHLDLDLGMLNGFNCASEATLKTNLDDDPFLSSASFNSNILNVVDSAQDMFDPPLQPGSSVDSCGSRSAKCSPWHESDSGVSDTVSVLGSPEHYMSDRKMHSPVDDDLDNELAAYLHRNEREVRSPTAQSISDNEDLCFFTNSLDKEAALLDIVSGDEFLGRPQNSKFKTKNVNSNNQDICQTASMTSGPSEVKILKVVRPSNTAAGVTSEDIAQAMEERSKKNAAQAKLNREKKKAYIQSLESEVLELKSRNDKLTSENERMKQEVADKDEEIDYLKSVLANSSALSSLLKNISNVKEVKLSAAIMTRRRTANDHSYNLVESPPQKRARLIDENLKKAGVCLHVSGGTACLEFCAHCSKLAKKTHAHS